MISSKWLLRQDNYLHANAFFLIYEKSYLHVGRILIYICCFATAYLNSPVYCHYLGNNLVGKFSEVQGTFQKININFIFLGFSP